MDTGCIHIPGKHSQFKDGVWLARPAPRLCWPSKPELPLQAGRYQNSSRFRIYTDPLHLASPTHRSTNSVHHALNRVDTGLYNIYFLV